MWRPWPGRTCDLTAVYDSGYLSEESYAATAIYSAHDSTHPNTGEDRYVGIHVGDFTSIEECYFSAEAMFNSGDYTHEGYYDENDLNDVTGEPIFKTWDIIAQLTFDSSFDPNNPDSGPSPCYWQNTPLCSYENTQY